MRLGPYPAAAGAVSPLNCGPKVSHIVGPLLPVVAKPAGLVFKVDSTGKPADAFTAGEVRT